MTNTGTFNRRSFIKLSGLAALGMPSFVRAAVSSPSPIPSTLSKVRERSISFYHLHTSEKLSTTYWIDGDYLSDSLRDINRLLRDHRSGEVHEIDRRLLDLLCALNIQLETREPFQIISGYRSPATNSVLRARSKGVAENSLHLKGMAADIRVAGRSTNGLRRAALALQAGGVGYYPVSQFVHVDVGRVRTW
jgi:uncharacterized protein YcbK (DUF882 family)